MGLRQRIHDIDRLRHILQVLIRYGFGYMVQRMRADHGFVGRKLMHVMPVRQELLDESPGVRLRKALAELGPTFVKFGQILSLRPDMVTPEIARELERLQDEVPPFPPEIVEHIIHGELKLGTTELFLEFDRVPKASASLAQVHRARLYTGEEVIVKVQRPGIQALIHSDIEILYYLAHLAERYIEECRVFEPVRLVDEFRASITRELDFVNEAYNIERFQREFAGDDTVVIPQVFPRYSGRRVLTMALVVGIKVSDIAALRAAGLDPKKIAENGANAVLKQIFYYGFFHADPHPGNLLALDGNRVAFLDFGMVGRLPSAMKARLADILVSLIHRDIPGVRDGFLAIGSVEEDEKVDIGKLDMDLEDLVERYYGKPLRQLNPGKILLNMIDIVSSHQVVLPTDLFLLSKVMITLDGVGRLLDPEFNLVDRSRPFVEELQRRRYSPARVAGDFRAFARAMYKFFRVLPRDLLAILEKVKHGTLKVEFEHKGLEQLTVELDKVSSRVAFSLIISALIVGSSIIVHANRGPEYFGLPLFGLIGFVAAGIMGVWLVIVILSSGRL